MVNETMYWWMTCVLTLTALFGSLIGAVILRAVIRAYKHGEPVLGHYALQPIRIFFWLAILSVVLNTELFIREQFTGVSADRYNSVIWDILKAAWALNVTYFFGIIMLQREERRVSSASIRRRRTGTRSVRDDMMIIRSNACPSDQEK